MSKKNPNSNRKSGGAGFIITLLILSSLSGFSASIVMFLLATMSIIEILNNNGCFDFIQKWIKTRNPNRLLWTITFVTFIVS